MPPLSAARGKTCTQLQFSKSKQQHCAHPKTSLAAISPCRENFEKTYNVLPTMGNILVGMSFFRKHSLRLDLKNNFVHFPDLSKQLKPHHWKIRCGVFELKFLLKIVVGPFQQVVLPTIAATKIDTSFGITEATSSFS